MQHVLSAPGLMLVGSRASARASVKLVRREECSLCRTGSSVLLPGFRRFNLRMLDCYGVRTAVFPARTSQGRYHYPADGICGDTIACIVPVLVPAGRTNASFSTPDYTLYVCREPKLLRFQCIRGRSQSKKLAHPMLLQGTTATSRKFSAKVRINDRDP